MPTAVVTGAAAGLGRAEAIGLARSGATVVVNCSRASVADARDRFAGFSRDEREALLAFVNAI